MNTPRATDEVIDSPPLPGEPETIPLKAWELIDVGRYQPRRIRGSFRGRELG